MFFENPIVIFVSNPESSAALSESWGTHYLHIFGGNYLDVT